MSQTLLLVEEVQQLLRAGQRLDVLEARMTWRLQRWKLQPQRTQALQVCCLFPSMLQNMLCHGDVSMCLVRLHATCILVKSALG